MTERNCILIERFPGETRAALIAGGRVAELFLERTAAPSRLGEIGLVRVSAVRQDLGGVFAVLNTGQGFVKVPAKSAFPVEGALIVAQVTKDAAGGKQIALRPGWEIKAENLVLTSPGTGLAISRKIRSDAKRRALRDRFLNQVPADCELTIRTSADAVSEQSLQDQLDRLRESHQRMARELASAERPTILAPAPPLAQRLAALFPGVEVIDATGTPDFERYSVEEVFEETITRVFEKDRDFRLTFDGTEALTAIDVDSAGAERVDAKAINLKAAIEIARLIKLRRDSGLIVIDFLRMPQKAARDAVFERLADLFSRDPLETRIHGWTKAGLFELTRQSSGPSLADQLCDAPQPGLMSAESAGLAALRRVIRGTRGVARPKLLCSPGVAQYLTTAGAVFVAECEEKIGGPIDIAADPSYPRHRTEIS